MLKAGVLGAGHLGMVFMMLHQKYAKRFLMSLDILLLIPWKAS